MKPHLDEIVAMLRKTRSPTKVLEKFDWAGHGLKPPHMNGLMGVFKQVKVWKVVRQRNPRKRPAPVDIHWSPPVDRRRKPVDHRLSIDAPEEEAWEPVERAPSSLGEPLNLDLASIGERIRQLEELAGSLARLSQVYSERLKKVEGKLLIYVRKKKKGV